MDLYWGEFTDSLKFFCEKAEGGGDVNRKIFHIGKIFILKTKVQ